LKKPMGNKLFSQKKKRIKGFKIEVDIDNEGSGRGRNSSSFGPDELKVIMVGDSGVGKSSLVLRYVDDFFSGDSQFISIGEDFKDKELELDGKKIVLHIWDTAGQERFRTITSLYYRGSHVILIVFDVTEKKSFDNVRHWFNDSKDKSYAILICLIGNKIDSDKRVITREEGEAQARSYDIPYFETSCATTEGVDYTFEEIARKAKEEYLHHPNANEIEEN